MSTYPQNIDLSNLSKIKASGAFTLIIKQGKTPSLDVTSDNEALLKGVSINRVGDVLELSCHNKLSFSGTQKIHTNTGVIVGSVIINGDNNENISAGDLINTLMTARKHHTEVHVPDNVQIISSETDLTQDVVTMTLTLPNFPYLHIKGSVYLEADYLTQEELEFKASGQSDVNIHGVFGAVAVEASGQSDVYLYGNTTYLTANVSGQADIRAKKLHVEAETYITASGQSDARVCAGDWAKVIASGQADVKVWGNPMWKEEKTSGLATVKYKR